VRPLANFVVTRRKAILIAAVVFIFVAGALGGGVTSQLSVSGYTDPTTESAQADAVLTTVLHATPPNLVILVTDKRGVDDPAVAEAATNLTQRLSAEASVAAVSSYWTSGRPSSLRDRAGDKALILVRVEGTDDEVQMAMAKLAPRYSGVVEGLNIREGGSAAANYELTQLTTQDAGRAEGAAFPLALLALVLVFGSVVAASLPLGLGLVAVVGALLVLRVVAALTPVSIFALNITTVLGLGLAIDYSLFIVTRYREEMAKHPDVSSAITTTLATAGRTVLFSAVVLALALAALLATPFEFMRSFAYAGIPTTLFAALASLVVLPAILVVLGPRVDRLRLFRPRTRRPMESGFWHRLATAVMRRPWPVLVGIVALLVILGLPFLHVRLGFADERALPPSADAFQVGQALRNEFDSKDADALLVVARGLGDPARTADLAAYAERLSALSDVARVDALTGTYVAGALMAPPGPDSAAFASGTYTYLRVVPSVDMTTARGQTLLLNVRASPAPVRALVTGPAAIFADSLDSLYRSLPAVLAWIAISMFVLLFLLTGSIVVPTKAVVLSALSLTATFGALVWGFQDGHLRGWLGDFAVTGTTTWTVLLLLFCVAFGLSMDYEVFLLSRIKEDYDATGDNTGAVARGLERTGRLVTAAAVVISLIFVALVTSGVTYLKVIGLGLTIAVVMDATLIRGVLVPAFMRLAGRANWWAPGPLRRLHAWLGVSETA
jgi:putative drug exporter of the RND superfamily